MKIKWLVPHDGQPAGVICDMPDESAAIWIKSGKVERVKKAAKPPLDKMVRKTKDK